MRKSVASKKGVGKAEPRDKRRRERRAGRPAIKLPAIKLPALPAYRKRMAGLVALASIAILLCLAGAFTILSGIGPGAGRATQTSAAASLLTAIMALPTSTATLTPEPVVPAEACVVQVRFGDTLGTVFADFRISLFQYGSPYYYFEQCDAGQAPFTCSSKTVIPDPDSIEQGWWIEIPGVGPEACADNGGRWASITE